MSQTVFTLRAERPRWRKELHGIWWLEEKLMAHLQLGMKIRERSVMVNERLGERANDRDWATAQWHHFVWHGRDRSWRRKSSRPHSENGLHGMAVFPMRMTTGRWLFLWLRSSSDYDRCPPGSHRSWSLPSTSSSKFISTSERYSPSNSFATTWAVTSGYFPITHR